MDSAQLAYFLRIAEMEHMTNAARTLHISQPALSRSIRLLEEELGVRLFDRVGRRLVLNEQGRAFYTATIQFQQSIEGIGQHVSNNRAITGEILVKISVQNTRIFHALAEFCACYPQIRLQQYSESLSPADGAEYDFIIDAYNPLLQEFSQPDCTELRVESYMLAVHASSPLSQRAPIALSEAKSIPFVLPLPQQPLREVISAYCHHAGFQPIVCTETNDYTVAFLLVERGSCVALVPSDAPIPITYTSVRRVPLKEQVFQRMLYLRCPSASERTPVQQCFYEFMVKQLKTPF